MYLQSSRELEMHSATLYVLRIMVLNFLSMVDIANVLYIFLQND